MFKKIDESSPNSVPSSIGFFETPTSNVGISSSIWREILTLNPVHDFPLHFKIPPTSSFIDLAHMFLETEMRIMKRVSGGNWVVIEDKDKIGTIQGIGAVWIKNLRVIINGRETFNSNSLYSYKSYLDMELSYPETVKRNFLNASGYFPSGLKQYDQNKADDEGFVLRKKIFEKGKTAQFFTKLNADIFSSDLLLINNVPIEIEIHPQNSEFMLLRLDPAVADTEYKIEITSCKLFVKTCELMDGLAMEVAKNLRLLQRDMEFEEVNSRVYLFHRDDMKYKQIYFPIKFPDE